MGLYSCIEKYAPEITVTSELSPDGRIEHGFIQPLDLKTETALLPLEGGNKYGKYLLITACDSISADETDAIITWAGRNFELISREELGFDEMRHIECLVRCIGGEKL